MGLFFIIFFSTVLVYIFFSLFLSFINTDKYVENLQMLRRFFYAIFVVGISIGLMLEKINLEDWKQLLELTALFVFIDLAVFQTPDILKIWNAEFKHDNYIRKIIKKNEEIISYNSQKVECFTDIVLNKSSNYLNNIPLHHEFDDYKEDLKTFLEFYTGTFQINVAIFEFENRLNENTEELHSNFNNLDIKQAFTRIEQCYNKVIEDGEWKEFLVQELLNGKAIELQNKKEVSSSDNLNDKKVFIIPFYGKDYDILIGISSKFIEVDGIDASHILNLTQIYDWYMD